MGARIPWEGKGNMGLKNGAYSRELIQVNIIIYS